MPATLAAARKFLEESLNVLETFPSIARIRVFCAAWDRDEGIRKKIEAQREGKVPCLVRVAGTPPTWEALFILMKNKQMQGGVWDLARGGKKLWADDEIMNAFYEWENARVDPKILERREKCEPSS